VSMSPHWLVVVFVALVIAATGATTGTSAPQRADTRIQTLATTRGHIAGFAQNREYLVWSGSSNARKCTAFIVMQRIRSGMRTRLCGDAADYPGAFTLAGARAFWEVRGGSNLTEFSHLVTASLRNWKPSTVAYQSIGSGGFDHLVPPASDGRSAYYWTSPEDATAGPLVRFDGRRRRRLTRTLPRLQALAAGEGRFAFARALWTYDCARDPAWSPDGTRIAFSSREERSWDGPCRTGLWTMNATGGGLRRVADAGRDPDWSPDGSQLAYTNAAGSLVVAAGEGGNARVIVARASDPAWSPDGTHIAFTRDSTLYVIDRDGTRETALAPEAAEPDWSPDSAKVAFARTASGNPGLSILDLESDGVRSLTADFDREPAWSPDGRTIAYAHCTNAHVACPRDATEIVGISPDGTGRRELTSRDDERVDLSPSWAPDSRRLVLARSEEWQDEGDFHIFTLRGRLTGTPPPRTPITVALRSGRVLAKIEPRGVAVALAVTRRTVGALVREGRAWRVDLYSPRRLSVSIPGKRGPTLAASGGRLIFHVGRRIYVLGAVSGRLRAVVRASATPVGLSIVGRRIAWAENLSSGARIRAVMLP
jgi:WD40 repeat protein